MQHKLLTGAPIEHKTRVGRVRALDELEARADRLEAWITSDEAMRDLDELERELAADDQDVRAAGFEVEFADLLKP